MTTFDERETGFEAKFAHDAELKFRVIAHRNKALGLWVGEQLGLTGEKLDAYVAAIIHAEVVDADETHLVARIVSDLALAGKSVTEAAIAAKMNELLQTSHAALTKGA